MIKLLRKATKPAPATPAERNAARRVKRDAYKAEVLTWAIADWHAHMERLRISCPDLWKFGVGVCPTEYTCRLGERYKSRNNIFHQFT
jgi:hypothetical protein